MAQKSNYAALNRIDELFDPETLGQHYPGFAEEVRQDLLKVRSADFAVLKSRGQANGEPDPHLVEAAQGLRRQLPRLPMVSYYMTFIDRACAQGI